MALIWPVVGAKPGSNVTNRFGARQARAPGMTGALPRANVGVDIAAALGTAIAAPFAGTVEQVYQAQRERDVNENHGYGGSVLIRSTDGRRVRLSHQQVGSIAVRPGEWVEAGQFIGRVGATGNTDNGRGGPFPHVDFEYKTAGGGFADPLGEEFGAAPMATRARAAVTGDTDMGFTASGGTPPPAPPPGPSRDETPQEKELKRQIAAREREAADAQRAYDAYVGTDPKTAAQNAGTDRAAALKKRVDDATAAAEKLKLDLAELESKPPPAPKAEKAEGPTPVAANTSAPYNVERNPDGTYTVRENPNYLPPAPPRPEKDTSAQDAVALQTAQVNLAIAQQRLADATSPAAQETARLALEKARLDLARAQRPGTLTANNTVYPLDERGLPLVGEGVALPETPKPPAAYTSGGQVTGLDPQTGAQVYTADVRSPTEKALAELDLAAKQYTSARQVFVTGLLERVVRGEVSQPDATRLLAQFDAVHQTRAEQLQAETNQRLQDDLLSRTTGYQYQNGTLVLDAQTGAPAKTVEQLNKERDAERAEATQRETERSNRTTEQQRQDTNAINLQNADETARNNLETNITSRMNARTDAVQAAGSTLLKDNIGPARQAADLGAASLVLSRSGLENLFRQYGASTGVATGILGAFDAHQADLARLQAQLQPVRRASLTPLAYAPPAAGPARALPPPVPVPVPVPAPGPASAPPHLPAAYALPAPPVPLPYAPVPITVPPDAPDPVGGRRGTA